MTSTRPQVDLPFEPPGPGTWELDPVHFPRPATRYWAELHPEPFARGVAEFTRFYGLLLGGMEMAYVNGFAYRAVTPAAESEIPERFQRAQEVFEGKLWREQLTEWDEVAKPASLRIHRELQAVDPDSLSDQDLVEHLRKCRDHHSYMLYQHMRFTGAAMVCVGDLLAHVVEWTGLAPSLVLGMMRGAAPVSAGASQELGGLIDAFRGDASAQALLESQGDPEIVLDKLLSLGNDVSRELSAYLDLVGYRLIDGFDISGRYALELPDALLRAIRTTVERGPSADSDVDVLISRIRGKVPEDHQAEFDDLLSEARLMYRIRDERGVYSDIWASGIARRAVLAAGRRAARAGRVLEAEHLIDAGFDEMVAIVSGQPGPSAQELAARYEYRTSHNAKEAPQVLGDPPHPPPDPSGLPPAPARMMRAVGVALGELFGSSEAAHEEGLLRGLAASGGLYEGPARRVSGPADFDRIVQGDVLVTESTTEAFNILLPLLGAIVTDAGGLLSHSAIVAREYGIPGVVGTREATDRIPDGATVLVDGDAGEVTIYR